MKSLLKELTLDNGLVLEITDESFNYYANFGNLKIVISGTVKVTPTHLRTICPANPMSGRPKEPWEARCRITVSSPG